MKLKTVKLAVVIQVSMDILSIEDEEENLAQILILHRLPGF